MPSSCDTVKWMPFAYGKAMGLAMAFSWLCKPWGLPPEDNTGLWTHMVRPWYFPKLTLSDTRCCLTTICQRNSRDEMIFLLCWDPLSTTNGSIFHCTSRWPFLQNMVDYATRATYSLCNVPVTGTCPAECQDPSSILNGNARLTTSSSHYCCYWCFAPISNYSIAIKRVGGDPW